MDNINNWNEELTIGTAISNIIDLEKRYFILQDRIDKAIEYIVGYCTEFGEIVHYGDAIDPTELLEILKGGKNE